jgi:hypothetical protein
MKYLIMLLALLFAAPSYAQLGIQIGPGDRDRDRGYGERHDRDRDRYDRHERRGPPVVVIPDRHRRDHYEPYDRER